MNGKEFCSALRNGRNVYGTMIVSNSPKWVETVKKIGMDFVFIDTEHIAIDRSELSWMCQAYRASNIAPIVRIPSPDPYQASMVIDAGACGVIAPYIETVEQVKALRGAVKFKPLKGKRLQDILDGKDECEKELGEYIDVNNEEHALIVNIESIPAMEALDDILKVPQLDAVLIGPHDLSCSLGIPEQYSHPEYEKAVRTIIRKARANNVGAGIHLHYFGGIEQEISWARDDGANFIVHSSDMLSFIGAMRDDLSKIKNALNDRQPNSKHGNINI